MVSVLDLNQNVAPPKQPINWFQPAVQRKQNKLEVYCPNIYTVQIGLAPSNNNNNRDSGAEPRMDLDENNDRLSAQVSQEHRFENLANS